jgi:(p)ppGpp synthase/HD superfamily hydrolase
MSATQASAVLTDKFSAALDYAVIIHAGQRRKGTNRPYVGHLLAVCAIVLQDGGSEDEAIGALLHEAAEDAGGQARLDDITARFGNVVGKIVEGCSDTLEWPKLPWCPRRRDLARLASEPEPVLRVSLADKIDNARAIVLDYHRLGERLWARFNSVADQRWYYRSLVEAFRAAPALDTPLIDELDRLVAELERMMPQAASALKLLSAED